MFTDLYNMLIYYLKTRQEEKNTFVIYISFSQGPQRPNVVCDSILAS